MTLQSIASSHRKTMFDRAVAVGVVGDVCRALHGGDAAVNPRGVLPYCDQIVTLLLQNLQYEKNHFLREIRHCRDFHGELAVDLVDKAAFARTAPAELRAADEASDPHQYHVNRLEHELRHARRPVLEAHAQRRQHLRCIWAGVRYSPGF